MHNVTRVFAFGVALVTTSARAGTIIGNERAIFDDLVEVRVPKTFKLVTRDRPFYTDADAFGLSAFKTELQMALGKIAAAFPCTDKKKIVRQGFEFVVCSQMQSPDHPTTHPTFLRQVFITGKCKGQDVTLSLFVRQSQRLQSPLSLDSFVSTLSCVEENHD